MHILEFQKYYSLIPQHYYKLIFLSTWATKSSCFGKRQSRLLGQAKRQSRAAQDFVMLKNSLILVLQNKQENSTIDMAKIHIKSEELTPFGEIFSGRGAIWLHIVFCNRLAPRSKV